MKLKVLALFIFVGTFFGLVGKSQAQMVAMQFRQVMQMQAIDEVDGGPFNGGFDDAQEPRVGFDDPDGGPAPEVGIPGEQVFVDDGVVIDDNEEETEEPDVELQVEEVTPDPKEDAEWSLQGSGGCSLMTTVPLSGPMGLLLASALALLPLWIRRIFK